jgi:hypothetical protein
MNPQEVIILGGAVVGAVFGLATFAAALWLNHIARKPLDRARDHDLFGDWS